MTTKRSSSSSRRVARALPLALLLAAAVPSTAFAQASRTWVSGVGDDANPCSRTAPCKTLPGAYSKTAVGGAINVIDPGGFGTLTIGHSITVDGGGMFASVLAAGTNGIVVNAPAGSTVIIRGLDINGINGSASPGVNGVRVVSVGTLRLENDNIYGFGSSGLDFEPSTPGELITVTHTQIHDNSGDGVLVAPQVGGWGRVTLRDTQIDDNTCGVAAGGAATGVFTTDCGTTSGTATKSAVNMFRTSIGDSAFNGVEANGANAVVRLSASDISGSVSNGLTAPGTGSIISFGNNSITGNNGTETINGSVALK